MLPGITPLPIYTVEAGSQSFTSVGTFSFVVPTYNTLTASVVPGTPGSSGTPGSPGSPGHVYIPGAYGPIVDPYSSPIPGSPGSPGGSGSPGASSSFAGSGSATYTRGNSTTVAAYKTGTVVVGSGGSGGAAGPGGAGGANYKKGSYGSLLPFPPPSPSGSPGSPGSPGPNGHVSLSWS